MLAKSEHYKELAYDLHTRERQLKAMRGEIQDRNGKVLAANRTVCTISVIHSQIKDADEVVSALSETLKMQPKDVQKKVEKSRKRNYKDKCRKESRRCYKRDGSCRCEGGRRL